MKGGREGGALASGRKERRNFAERREVVREMGI